MSCWAKLGPSFSVAVSAWVTPPTRLVQRTKAEAYRTQIVASIPNAHAPSIRNNSRASRAIHGRCMPLMFTAFHRVEGATVGGRGTSDRLSA